MIKKYLAPVLRDLIPVPLALVLLLGTGCGALPDSAGTPAATRATPTAEPTVSLPALTGAELGDWACREAARAIRDVRHDNPDVMRPISEAAIRSEVPLLVERGKVLRRKIREAEADRNPDGTVWGVEISTATLNLTYNCDHAIVDRTGSAPRR